MARHLDGLAAGKPVPGEVDLAADCHVSRTTVRKVLGRMEAKGLVRWADGRRVLARRVLPADAPPPAPEPVSREQQVARFVLEKIARNELQPGQSLSEKGIATELGVSTGPVREAMLTLAPLGLIRKRARRQWEVAALDVRQWEELMELRTLIEGYCLDKLLAGGSIGRHRAFLQQQRTKMRQILEAPAIAGTTLTEFGPVTVNWSAADEGALTFEIENATNREAVVSLRLVGGVASLIVDGRTLLRDGHSVGDGVRLADGRVQFALPPGRHSGRLTLTR
jgi:DNA-binding GntR family transcriptional regulator